MNKKTIFLFIVLILTMTGFGQENDSTIHKNKMDINVISLLYGHLKIGYERAISDKTAFHLILGKIDFYRRDDYGHIYSEGYSIEFQGKRYFKPQKYNPKFNFFVGVYSYYKYEYIEETYMSSDENHNDVYKDQTIYSNSFCVGVISGIKFVQLKRFTTELNIGLGYNTGEYMLYDYYQGLAPKLELSFGVMF